MGAAPQNRWWGSKKPTSRESVDSRTFRLPARGEYTGAISVTAPILLTRFNKSTDSTSRKLRSNGFGRLEMDSLDQTDSTCAVARSSRRITFRPSTDALRRVCFNRLDK